MPGKPRPIRSALLLIGLPIALVWLITLF